MLNDLVWTIIILLIGYAIGDIITSIRLDQHYTKRINEIINLKNKLEKD